MIFKIITIIGHIKNETYKIKDIIDFSYEYGYYYINIYTNDNNIDKIGNDFHRIVNIYGTINYGGSFVMNI